MQRQHACYACAWLLKACAIAPEMALVPFDWLSRGTSNAVIRRTGHMASQLRAIWQQNSVLIWAANVLELSQRREIAHTSNTQVFKMYCSWLANFGELGNSNL